MVNKNLSLWFDKIDFLKESKKFFEKEEYKGVNLWNIISSEIYTYYTSPEEVSWRKKAMIIKCLFTKDRFKLKGESSKIFVSFIMARSDHHELLKKSLEKFKKSELLILDAFEYKTKSSIFKYKYKLPNISLLRQIQKKFKQAGMKEILKEHYNFFLVRTYFRCQQIDQFINILNKYKPKAYIAFCSQAFPEEGIMTELCKLHKIPTFTLQHGFFIEPKHFIPPVVLQENLISDYNLIWGEKTAELLYKYTDPNRILIVGNPKYSNVKLIKKKSFKAKQATVFLPVIGKNSSSQRILSVVDEFAQKNPEIKINLSLHPFDDIKNYPNIKAKNIHHIKELAPIKDLIKGSDFVILHNTTIALEMLQFGIPIFRFKDKYLVELWENDDLFSTVKELEELITKAKNKSVRDKWIKVYHKAFKENFYQSKKEISQVYYDTIIRKIKNK